MTRGIRLDKIVRTDNDRAVFEKKLEEVVGRTSYYLHGTLVLSPDGDHVLIPITGEDGIPTIQIISSERLAVYW